MHASPAEVSPPEPQTNPMPAPSEPPPQRSVGVPIIAAMVLLLIAAIVSALVRHGSVAHPNSARVSASALGPSALRLTGTTEAVHMRAIVAPMLSSETFATLTITHLVANGARVRQGDLLAEFDRQAQMHTFIDKQAEYVDLANKASEAQAKEVADRAKDETEIGKAESALSKAQLEMQKVELLSKIDAEKADETLQEAKATLAQLRTTFDRKRQSAQAGIRLLEIQRDRAKQVMEHAQANAALMQIRSPIDGVAVLSSIFKSSRMAEVQEGDQIRPGVTFMQVVDPSQMQVRASVNQEDYLSLQIGMPARIRLDAYPELAFAGKLEEMAPIARTSDFSSKLRSFSVVFSIEGNDAKLMPDLSAAVDVNPSISSALSPGHIETRD
ncbi:MAG TPA: efflux RND transporter periplasmic adaptor subunit [Terriglobales bacterium]